jgi:ABC-type dipeptide/oligopeptide/nickel transport system permease component/ABC-type transport system substrate-binding protein
VVAVLKILIRFLAWTCIAGFLVIALAIAIVALLTPTISDIPEPYDAAEAGLLSEARKVHIDFENPPRIQVEVNYEDGQSANWYPNGESPILSELHLEGRLPPVEERVGSEPVVFRGVDGTGKYGGTWFRLNLSNTDIGRNVAYMSGSLLVRWSPNGYPIVPHVAKNWTHSADYREWTFFLREGMKWSDGHPFTTEDFLYWWNWDINYFQGSFSATGGGFPQFMRVEGQTGEMFGIDSHTLKFVFPIPNRFFLENLATAGTIMGYSPKHYMAKFHPEIGDQVLIKMTMKKLGIGTPESLYREREGPFNPEHPRLWPWVYRTYKPGTPQVFVRNPYYFAVDTEGNQLPYLDRLFCEVKSSDLLSSSLTSGDIGMHARLTGFNDYTEYMSKRKAHGYRVHHWYISQSSYWAIWPNLNRRVDPKDPSTEKKHKLLNNKMFRQALSLAINRIPIIETVMSGFPPPAQIAPGPASQFHHEKLFNSYIKFDPDRANAMLDAIGLTRRDVEGYRTFPDDTRMTWYLNYPKILIREPVQFVIDDWRRVGIRAVPKERSLGLFGVDTAGLTNDFAVWQGLEQLLPVVGPSDWIPVSTSFRSAVGFAKWYIWGGLYGDPRGTQFGGIEPPVGHPLRRSMEILDDARRAPNFDEQKRIFKEVFDIAAEELWSISIWASPPHPVIVKDGFHNVPEFAVYSPYFTVPSHAGMDTYYLDHADDSPGTIAQLKREMIEVTPKPRLVAAVDDITSLTFILGQLLRWMVAGILIAGVILVAKRHPFVSRRLVIIVPTLFIISIVAFFTIQLPPGNFIESKIIELEASGMLANRKELEEIRAEFHLDRSVPFQYAQWVGLNWFLTFEDEDRGLLHGNLGRSMEYRTSVNSIVGDRILLTVTVAFATILLTWAIALPIGIYSAVRQYSWGDYFFTFIGFVGMSVPGFLLALVLVFVSAKVFGINTLGLFSPEFAAQQEWTWPKIIDLMQHIWIPVAIIAVAGVGGMLRVMRGNLLDELNKPYVVTARAKGVRPFKLLMKYPVRIALNPFISSIGYLFPHLISGGAIVAIVLSLPMVGPLILSAFLSEDLYLAGSMLMVLSLLGVLGTLVSDLLLLWLDPRIRMEGGVR